MIRSRVSSASNLKSWTRSRAVSSPSGLWDGSGARPLASSSSSVRGLEVSVTMDTSGRNLWAGRGPTLLYENVLTECCRSAQHERRSQVGEQGSRRGSYGIQCDEPNPLCLPEWATERGLSRTQSGKRLSCTPVL